MQRSDRTAGGKDDGDGMEGKNQKNFTDTKSNICKYVSIQICI